MLIYILITFFLFFPNLQNPPAIPEHFLARASSLRRGSSNINTAAIGRSSSQENSLMVNHQDSLPAASPTDDAAKVANTSSVTSADGLGPLKPASPAVAASAPSKRLGVSAEPTLAMQNAAPVEIKYYDKDAK